MNKLLSLLCGILALCTLLSACAATIPSDEIPGTTASLSTASPTVTEPPTEAGDETSAETLPETEIETEPAPEVLVSAIPPKQVLKTLPEEVNVLSITTVSKQVTLNDVNPDDVKNAFLDEGYILSATKSVPETKLQIFVLKSLDHVVTLTATSGGSLHVLWEKAAEVSVEPLYADRTAATGAVTMAQIGIERGNKEDNPMIGMCYVYRLADGSAVILDGGVNNKGSAGNLYKTLQKLDIAKDENGKLRITAWIFSHGHADHVGTFKKFAELYGDQIHLTYVMHGIPTTEIISGGQNAEELDTLVRETYPSAKRVSPHAGLTYFFGNLAVQVLYAPELIYTSEGISYYNNSSLILRLEANGQSVLHMGDAGEAAAKAAMTENQKAAFQSGALQITHHGLYTGAESHQWVNIKKIYQATDATLGLLPMGTRKPEDGRNGRHTVLVGWGSAGYQISFVLNTKPLKNNSTNTDQSYYNQYVADIAAGIEREQTLFGYDGINTITNRYGLVTYISSSEDDLMATILTLSDEGMTVSVNEKLAAWLGE